MKRRISHLISVASVVADAPDAPVARDRICKWILAEASRTGGNRHRIRRNLIWSNRVRGKDATSTFAALIWQAAAHQIHDPLYAVVRAGDDEQALREHLTSLVPADAPLTSARWIEQQVLDHDLDRHLTATLLRRSRLEYDELRSLVGVWLAHWGAEGRFDDCLAEKGGVPLGTLVNFLRGKIRSHHYRRGSEPVERQRGARTGHEVQKRRSGRNGYLSRGAEKISTDAPRITLTYDQSDRIDGFDVIDPHETAEDRILLHGDTRQRIADCEQQIRQRHPKAATRYLRVFRLMAAGRDYREIAVAEGISEGRAAKVTSEIRVSLRQAETTRQNAHRILALIASEPYSTRSEIEADLALGSDQARASLNLLRQQGAIREAPGESYCTR